MVPDQQPAAWLQSLVVTHTEPVNDCLGFAALWLSLETSISRSVCTGSGMLMEDKVQAIFNQERCAWLER